MIHAQANDALIASLRVRHVNHDSPVLERLDHGLVKSAPFDAQCPQILTALSQN